MRRKSKMLVQFISKDGSRFEKQVPQPFPAKVELPGSTGRVTGTEIAVLARAMFDRKLSAEATRRGEGNVERALQIMWDRTKTDVRDACMLEAEQTLSLRRAPPRTYKLHRSASGADMYIELGTCFVDLAPKATAAALGAIDTAIQADVTAQRAKLEKHRGLYGIQPADEKLQAQRVEDAWKARQQKILELEDKLVAEEKAKTERKGCDQGHCLSCNPGQKYPMSNCGPLQCMPGWNANLKF